MRQKNKKQLARSKRHSRIRKKVIGSQEKPRLHVFKSNKHIYVQFVDDMNQKTLFTISTLSNDNKDKKSNHCNKKHAETLGELSAKRALEAGIKKVVFDRGGYQFHGCMKVLADTARKAGLEF